MTRQGQCSRGLTSPMLGHKGASARWLTLDRGSLRRHTGVNASVVVQPFALSR
jgi:hypothetical protein